MADKININHQIRASSMRIIGPNGENFGVMTKEDAIAKSKELHLDLIEVSPNADPPVSRITDYGKYIYELSKKQKEVKAKAHVTETKNVQVSTGISEHDIMIKVKQAAEWIKEGHRVKIELQLKGRTKYLDDSFLRERLMRILAVIPIAYNIAEPLKKLPKSYMIVLEKAR